MPLQGCGSRSGAVVQMQGVAGREQTSSHASTHVSQADERHSDHVNNLPDAPACATFDCYGAGRQWVTQHLFGGLSWQSSPEVASRMFMLYPRYRALHELMALLDLAIMQVPSADAAPLEQCLLHIEGICHTEAVGSGAIFCIKAEHLVAKLA